MKTVLLGIKHIAILFVIILAIIRDYPGNETTASIGSRLFDDDGDECNRSFRWYNNGIILQEIWGSSSLYIVFGDNPLSGNRKLYDINRIIGCLWLVLGDKEKAIESFDRAYRHAVEFEKYKDSDEYSSLLMSGVECDSHDLWSESAIHDFAQRIKTQQI